jgi:hypothetical protein
VVLMLRGVGAEVVTLVLPEVGARVVLVGAGVVTLVLPGVGDGDVTLKIGLGDGVVTLAIEGGAVWAGNTVGTGVGIVGKPIKEQERKDRR